MMRRAFTLIELLVIAAVFTILAAIAVPTSMEAQVRAKVSRCRADQRKIVMALEAYAIDTGAYVSTMKGINHLSTPVAYLAAVPDDVFQPIVRGDTGYAIYHLNFGPDGRNYIYHGPPTFNNSNVALKYNIRWALTGLGPDHGWFDNTFPGGAAVGDYPPYDPSNGTISRGNIERIGPGSLTPELFRQIWDNRIWKP